MNKKVFFIIVVCIAFAFFTKLILVSKKQQNVEGSPTIGIIIPLTHPSLQKIVRGFCDELKKRLDGNCSFLIRDAHGDQHVQQPAIIDEMKYKKVDLMVPIGTLCTQMTLQKAPEIPTIALAASPNIITKGHNATGIHDEIEAKDICEFIKQIIPNITKFSVIATQSEKTLPELESLRHHALNAGIALQTIFVQTPSDIYLATHSINHDSQAIFILKDHMVVSSIATLAQVGKERKIPVIASDEGSVSSGATCALGVEEENIGKAGAESAALILQGKQPQDIPVKALTNLAVFINKHACDQQQLSVKNLEHYAKKNNYQVIPTSKE